MNDKRKQNRIQGGWASAIPQPRSKATQEVSKVRENKSLSSPFSPSGGTASASTSADVNVVTGSVWASGQSCAPENQKPFIYKHVSLNQEPSVKVIEKAGDHIISTQPSGISKVKLIPGFIELKDCDWMFQQLRDELTWQQEEVTRHGETYLQPRLTSWVAEVPYTYSGITHKPNPQWSSLLRMIKDRIEESTGYVFNSLLANLYRDGHDHVSWHCDDEPELGSEPTIASLSFGDTRNFELRKKPPDFATALNKEDLLYSEYVKVPLDAGSLLIMDGAVQLDWQSGTSIYTWECWNEFWRPDDLPDANKIG